MHRSRVLAVPLGILVSTLAPSRASAQPPVEVTYTPIAPAAVQTSTPVVPSLPATAPTAARQWYGSQVLAADGLTFALGLAVARAASPDSGFLVLGAGWILGAPMVHVAHHRTTTALASLALRAGLLAGGYYAGGPCKTTCTTASGPCAQDPNASDHWQTVTTTCDGRMALLLGSMVASAIDSAFMSFEEVAPTTVAQSSAAATPSRRGVHIDNAGVFPLEAGAGLTLGGRF
jgi:hypothetical protein